MTFFFGDGFDCYSSIADLYVGGSYWDSSPGNVFNIGASGRFSGSRSLVCVSNSPTTAGVVKASGSNDAVHHINVAYLQTIALASTNIEGWFTLYDGTTAQCTVAIRSDGAILLISGASDGVVRATYATGMTIGNVWYSFEFEIVINSTTGSFKVRKNGNTSDDFSATGLNTRGGTANNYANKVGLGQGVGSFGQIYTDDFLWRSDASSVAWIGDVRCYTRMPAADSTVQFSRSGSVVPVAPYPAGSSVFTGAAQYYAPFTATCNGTIGSMLLYMAAANTGNMKCALFNNSGSNSPGTVLAAASAAVTNPVLGSNSFTFSSPPSVTQGTTYWVGFATDSLCTFTIPAGNSGYGVTNGTAGNGSLTYTAFPAANPTVNVNVAAVVFNAGITPTTAANANFVAEVVQDAALGYVLSSTSGQADLYTLQAVSSTPFPPATIIGVTTRGLFKKSDAGTRNATVQLKSGGTTVAGVSTALSAGSWQWIARNDLVDPATSAAWTPSGVNAALIGPSVTA